MTDEFASPISCSRLAQNAEENGGWDPVDLWNVDDAIADDMLTVARLIRESRPGMPAISALKRKSRLSGAVGVRSHMPRRHRIVRHECRGCPAVQFAGSRRSRSRPGRHRRRRHKATYRFLEFFTANIRNKNTRMAYVRALRPFLAWCEKHGRGLEAIDPISIAAYIEQLQDTHAKPTSAAQGRGSGRFCRWAE